MWRQFIIPAALALTLAVPFALKPRNGLLETADETLVIVTPHNEAIRAEFALGFRDWYRARTGKTARIDWRIPGGTSEIARFLQSEYQGAFENYWKAALRRGWAESVKRAFDDPKAPTVAPQPVEDNDARDARKAFLNSNVGIGIDLFFGGGAFDFAQQAGAGRLVDSGFIAAHAELFGEGPAQIPQMLGGEPFWDKKGAWFGTVLSAFGICYNADMTPDGPRSIAPIRDSGAATVRGVSAGQQTDGGSTPANWADLAKPRYMGQVALADPNKSGSVAKAFEMIIQQQMAEAISASAAARGDSGSHNVQQPPDVQAAIEKEAISRGWDAAMRLIQKMGANTRYFTDSATKIPMDVADGDAAIGMCIDFYGRFESETAFNASGGERLRYFNPPGGTSIGVDPIGLLRGAPHRELALAFMEYVMSLEGQKLWNWRVGTPGGPRQYALRRLPIRRELYAPEFAAFRSDPGVFPYDEGKNFIYHPEWTGALFNPIRFIVRVMCVDSHEEARDAWAALIRAGMPAEASRVFADVSAVAYSQANGRIKKALGSGDPLAQARLATELGERFREQYRRAATLARGVR